MGTDTRDEGEGEVSGFVCDGTCGGDDLGDCSHWTEANLLVKDESASRMWKERALASEKALRKLENKVKADNAKRARKASAPVCADLRHVCGGCGFRWPERSAYDELILENAALKARTKGGGT